MQAPPQHYPYLHTFYKGDGLFKQLELIPGIGEETLFLTDRNHRNVVYKLDLINVTSGISGRCCSYNAHTANKFEHLVTECSERIASISGIDWSLPIFGSYQDRSL